MSSSLVNRDGGGDATDKTQLATEILWCCEYLRDLREKGKLSEKKIKDAQKCVKVMTNPATPLPKIRQAMRNSCGDYKAKMAAEAEVRLRGEGEQISSCDLLTAQQSNFIKKSLPKSDHSKIDDNKVEFKFNFNIEN